MVSEDRLRYLSRMMRFHVIHGVVMWLVVIVCLGLAAAYVTVPLNCGLAIWTVVTKEQCEVAFVVRKQIESAWEFGAGFVLVAALTWGLRHYQLRKLVKELFKQ